MNKVTKSPRHPKISWPFVVLCLLTCACHAVVTGTQAGKWPELKISCCADFIVDSKNQHQPIKLRSKELDILALACKPMNTNGMVVLGWI